jgi:hypothetical protein
MSMYAVVLDVIRRNPGLTPSQITAKVPGATAEQIDPQITLLKANGMVTQTGATYATATFAVTTKVI